MRVAGAVFELFRCSQRLTVCVNLKISRNMATKAEFGSWKSPITSKLATESSVSFQEVRTDNGANQQGQGRVYWSEMRFDEGGRYVICSADQGQEGYTSLTPKDYNARTKVHEYGGGSFLVNNGTIYFSNFKDQRLYAQTAADKVEPVSQSGNSCRYADGEFSNKLGKLFYVCEDHTLVEKKEAKEPVNSVIMLDPASGKQFTLAKGCDFYASPRVSPDGKRIAWIQWVHPNMPWDSTELWTADLNADGSAIVDETAKKVAGGTDISVIHPSWTSDNLLLYISDITDWWNLYLVSSSGEHVNLRPCDKEIGQPHWTFARFTYSHDPKGSGNIATAYRGELGILNVNDKSYRKLDTGFDNHYFLQYSADGNIYCQGGSPTKFPCILRVNPESGKADIIRESRSVPVDAGYLSIPEAISWKTGNGEAISHGYFYAPKNKDFVGLDGTLPPLLVKAHGGPTASCSNILNLGIQYFTSRGFAVLDTNYRGSTGYGKKYRHSLRKKWGVYDVEDCSSGAKFLADSKKVDGQRLCIDGGSAGGYTTLACLAFTDVFKAGASHYGIADLGVLVQETHKFESRYCDGLLGEYPKMKSVFDERSPIQHIDGFNCPIAFFQGDEDEIVPPNQAQMMFEAVKKKNLPCAFVLFKGEQHGFRRAQNIQKALDGEFYFFAKVFGFEPAEKHCKLEITNLKG